MSNITPEQIAEIRAALKAATPGEWETVTTQSWSLSFGTVICGARTVTRPYGVEDAALIALLHNHAPALLDALELQENDVRIHRKVLAYVLFVLTGSDKIKVDLCDDVQMAADKMRADLEEARKENAILTGQKEAVIVDLVEVQEEYDNACDRRDEYVLRLDAVSKERDEARAEIDRLRAELARLRAVVAQYHEATKDRCRYCASLECGRDDEPCRSCGPCSETHPNWRPIFGGEDAKLIEEEEK